jgi:hypothetical protein
MNCKYLGVTKEQGTNYVLRPPPVLRNILDKERKLEKVVSLEELSLAMTMHFKIKAVYVLSKVINTLCVVTLALCS